MKNFEAMNKNVSSLICKKKKKICCLKSVVNELHLFVYYYDSMSCRMAKPTICIGENKGADQHRSYCKADQRLCRLPSAPIFPVFSYIFRASYFFLYFDPKSYIFPSNSYIFQNAADNNEISRKNHGILV